MADQDADGNPAVGTKDVSYAQALRETKRRKHRFVSFQRMAAIQDEIIRIDQYLGLVRGGITDAPDSAECPTEDETVDPAVISMLTVPLCQLAASGDAVGVRILLRGGADPNGRDYDERTVLHIACMSGSQPVVKVLLEFGADCALLDRDGKTPQTVAEESGHRFIAMMLGGASKQRLVSFPDSFAGYPCSSCSSPVSQSHQDLSLVPQPMQGSLIVIMVGLPGRGKTYIAQQIRRYFQWNGLASTIFSHQFYRRRTMEEAMAQNGGSAAANDPMDMELRVAATIARVLTTYIRRTGGVAILDGTNTTPMRRQTLYRAIKETGVIVSNRVIFVEVCCSDKGLVHRNILRAIGALPHPPADFVERYYEVMAQHEAVYEPLNPIRDNYLSYIRIDDNQLYALNMITGWMPSRLAYMLHNLSHTPVNLYLTRAGEYVDMVAGRIGGNSRLTERGKAYSIALFEYFTAEFPDHAPLTVLASCAKRCTQTVHYFAQECIKQYGHSPITQVESVKLNCRVSYFPTLDDINRGDCEGQLLSEVRRTMPSTLQAMQADPWCTAWPNGESIHQVYSARLEPHIHDIQASSTPVLVVSHLALLQGLYSYFVTNESKVVAPHNAHQIDIPFECVIKIVLVGDTRVAEVIDLSEKVSSLLQAQMDSTVST